MLARSVLRSVLLAAFFLIVLGGCRHRGESRATAGASTAPASTAPRVNGRRLRRLLSIAGGDLNCAVGELTQEQVTDRIYRVRGCNDWRDYAIFGRRHRPARWRRVVPIADRAQADFGCPAASITFTPTSATSYTASGCGSATGYQLSCTEEDCGWMGAAPTSGSYAASFVIIVPATDAPLSIDVDGEVDDDGAEDE